MQSSAWLEKRWKVIERCHRVCEGCGNRRATEVHHLRYPKRLMPGSPEWIAQEKLYDLVGLCENCHHDVHHDWESAETRHRTSRITIGGVLTGPSV